MDVNHVDDHNLCCQTPGFVYIFLFLLPYFASLSYLNIVFLFFLYVLSECVSRARNGKICIASFDWNCTGVCNSVERMEEVHRRCGEANLKQIRMMSYDNKTKDSENFNEKVDM